MKRYLILSIALLILTTLGSAETIDLTAGEVKQVSVFNNQVTDRWIGVSGNTFRGTETVENHSLGDLIFVNSQAGDVISKDIQGLKGGGYFFGALPFTQEFNKSRIKSLGNLSMLEKGELFDKKDYPAFYPNYEDYYDAPNNTFTSMENITVLGQNYTAAEAELNQNISYFMLRYNTSENGVQPFFIATIDGKNRDSLHENCYNGESCNFEMILPRFNGSDAENPYKMVLLSKGPVIRECGVYNGTGTTYISGEISNSQNSTCLNINSTDLKVDFANNRFEGPENNSCGFKVSGSSKVEVFQAEILDFNSSICVENSSDILIKKSDIQSNNYGVSAFNSSLKISNTTLENDGWEINADRSTVNAERVAIPGTAFSAEFFNLQIDNYNNYVSINDSVGSLSRLGRNLEIDSINPSSWANRLGLFYPPVNQSKIAPKSIFKINENSSYSSGDPEDYRYIVNEIEDVKIEPSEERRFIYVNRNLTDFSIFSVYGSEIQPTKEVVEEEVVVEKDTQEEDTEPPAPLPPSQPEPVRLNISAPEVVEIRKNNPKRLSFQAQNYGSIRTGRFNVSIDLGENWRTTRQSFESISAGEKQNGSILLAASEEAPTGNITAGILAQKDGSILDYESIKLEVLPEKSVKRVDVVESPQFLDLEEDSTRNIGLLVENTGDFDVENMKLEPRNLQKCVSFGNRSYNVSQGSRKTIEFEANAVSKNANCRGYIELREGDQTVGFTALSVSIDSSKPQEGSPPVIIPLVLLIWTMVTAYMVNGYV